MIWRSAVRATTRVDVDLAAMPIQMRTPVSPIGRAHLFALDSPTCARRIGRIQP
jgi:hypothetical protein